jgi:hypothetical protein
MYGQSRKALLFFVAIAVISMLGCNKHETGSVQKALIGHWNTGTENIYVSENALISVFDTGTRVDSTYSVLQSNEDQNWIDIRTTTNVGKGHDKHLQFSRDRTSITQTISIPLFGTTQAKIPGEWKYVDAKTSP